MHPTLPPLMSQKRKSWTTSSEGSSGVANPGDSDPRVDTESETQRPLFPAMGGWLGGWHGVWRVFVSLGELGIGGWELFHFIEF